MQTLQKIRYSDNKKILVPYYTKTGSRNKQISNKNKVISSAGVTCQLYSNMPKKGNCLNLTGNTVKVTR